MRASVIVATHRPYDFPSECMYLPVHVGSHGKDTVPGAVRDDSGDNISALNYTYCELSGLYWLWRNGDAAEIYGLAHYRRFFAGTTPHPSGHQILGPADVSAAMGSASVMVARRRFYGIESVRSHYRHAHHEKDLDLTRSAIESLHPEYLAAFDRVMARRSLSLYNMFLMRAPAFDNYCTWLFGVLERVYRDLDMTGYSQQDQRVIGYIGERLLNVWVEYNSASHNFVRRKVVQLEGEPVVRKGLTLVRRKWRRGSPL